MTTDNPNRDGTAQIEDIAWIETVLPEEATGYVKSLYEGFQKQRGWIPNILKSTSHSPRGDSRLGAVVQYPDVRSFRADPPPEGDDRRSGLSRQSMPLLSGSSRRVSPC